MTTAQRAALINEKINQARGYVTDALEKMGNTGKQIESEWQRVKNSISIYVNDTLAPSRDYDPDIHAETGMTEANYYKNLKEYERLKGEAKAKMGRWLARYRKLKGIVGGKFE